MYTEIEAKLKVESLQEIENKLKKLDAEFIAEQLQTDTLFDDSNATLTNTDRCLRLRRQVINSETRFFLTYKGAKEESNYKRRQEIEIEVSDADSTEKLLSVLGYERKLSVEKKRGLWKFGECEVALDRLELLGDFVEIEGPDDEKISRAQKTLGLESLPHIPKSYASMIVEKSKQIKKEQKQI